MKVVVVGAGAIGSILAAKFVEAGHSVTLVARPDHAAVIRANGLRVEGNGEQTYRVDTVAMLPAPTTADATILAVKTFDLAAAASGVGRVLRPPSPILLPQNGLGVERAAEEALTADGWTDSAAWLVRAVNGIPATWVAPGIVRLGGSGEILLPDPAEAGPARAHVERFEELLRSSGIPVRVVRRFARELWRKAIVNAAINPVTAVRGIPNGRLLEEPWRSESVRLLREAERAAATAGINISDAEADADFERVVRATALNRSSMLQDLDLGRPTEIDAISGEILRTAESYGLDLPATRAIVEEVKARAGRVARRPQSS